MNAIVCFALHELVYLFIAVCCSGTALLASPSSCLRMSVQMSDSLLRSAQSQSMSYSVALTMVCLLQMCLLCCRVSVPPPPGARHACVLVPPCCLFFRCTILLLLLLLLLLVVFFFSAHGCTL